MGEGANESRATSSEVLEDLFDGSRPGRNGRRHFCILYLVCVCVLDKQLESEISRRRPLGLGRVGVRGGNFVIWNFGRSNPMNSSRGKSGKKNNNNKNGTELQVPTGR